MIAWLAAGAWGQDLPAIAARDGTAAVDQALGALLSSTKAKKLPEALAAAGLSRVELPVTAGLGADLVVRSAGPLRGCEVAGDAVSCAIPLQTTAPVREGEYQLTCRSRLGASVPLPSRLQPGATGGEAALAVPDVRPCWRIDGASLELTPVSGSELEGVGAGNDLVPPELVGLTKRQVEETIGQHQTEFRYCLVSKGRPGLTGKVIVDYRIGADGAMAEVTVASSTLGDPAVEGCLLERFRAIAFPRPNDGYDRGTWPVTFQ